MLIKLIKIPKIEDDCFLYFAQTKSHIPFNIRRIYYIIGAKPSLDRGAHAHYKTKQALFCIQGSITMVLDNGKKVESVVLDKPDCGILLEPLVWHIMRDFKKNTILLILASRKFSKRDYIRDYQKYLKIVN